MESLTYTIIGGLIVGAIVLLIEYRFFKNREGRESAPEIIIGTPKNKESLTAKYGETKPYKRDIVGEVIGIKLKEIKKLGLYVEVSIKTDTWYLQGASPVHDDSRWKVVGRFGGTRHIVRAELKDSYGHTYAASDIEVSFA
jgi:hypothetical protein